MSYTVMFAVILAAALHATWNAAVKGGADKLTQMAAVTAGHSPFAVVAILISPTMDWSAWPYLIGGAIFHFGYQIFLVQSYKLGDLSQVYPIARGTAPLVVTLVSVTFLNVPLSTGQIIGILMVAGGIIFMGLQRAQKNATQAMITAIITGCFIASYSLNDGYGARVSQNALAFYGYLSLLNAALFSTYVYVKGHVNPLRLPFDNALTFWGGGLASYGAYQLVVWSFTHAPIAMVTALRETSMIFALIISVLFMNERLNALKIAAVCTTLAGVIIMRLNS